MCATLFFCANVHTHKHSVFLFKHNIVLLSPNIYTDLKGYIVTITEEGTPRWYRKRTVARLAKHLACGPHLRSGVQPPRLIPNDRVVGCHEFGRQIVPVHYTGK